MLPPVQDELLILAQGVKRVFAELHDESLSFSQES
jgi:hypothetical protein